MRTLIAALALTSVGALATSAGAQAQTCSISDSTVAAVQAQLATVVNLSDFNGGIFHPNMMWSAIVDRSGFLCSVEKVGDAWPGSRAIAIAKAGTANDFSNVKLALSTANLYASVQPGGSLWGLNESNPFNPEYLPKARGLGKVPGGIITFGGGVALYQGGKVIGGLGVSGDSSCADHSIAYRMRKAAGLDGIPGGVAPDGTDNIIYTDIGSVPKDFEQPHCFKSDLTPDQIAHPPSH